MTPNDNFQDDKTRIGVGISFGSSGNDGAKDIKPDKKSDGFVDNKTRIGTGGKFSQPIQEPSSHQQSSPPSPTPHFAQDKTRIGAPIASSSSSISTSTPEDDLLFIAEMPTGPLEFPLVSGTRMTVGRENSQNIVVNDKTLSRHHLILERKGDTVTIQILGLNGLVHNGITHKSKTIEISAPSSFTIGKITCRLKKKVDSDATLFMADPAQFAQKDARNKSVPPPFPEPNAKWSDFPQQSFPQDSSQAPPPPIPPKDFSSNFESEQKKKDSSPFSTSSSSPSFEDFDGQSSWDDPFSSSQQNQQHKGSLFSFISELTPQLKYAIIGGAVLLVIIIVALVFFLKGKSPEDQVIQQAPIPYVPVPETPPVTQTTPPQEAVSTEQPNTKNYNLHGRYFNEAYRYYNEGNYIMSCDYLKDIPRNSAFRERAENLALQMGSCNLDD